MAEAPLSALLSAMGGVLLYPLVGLQWNRGSNCTHGTHTAHTPEALHGAAARCGTLRALGSWLACVAGRPLRRPHVGPALTSALPRWQA